MSIQERVWQEIVKMARCSNGLLLAKTCQTQKLTDNLTVKFLNEGSRACFLVLFSATNLARLRICSSLSLVRRSQDLNLAALFFSSISDGKGFQCCFANFNFVFNSKNEMFCFVFVLTKWRIETHERSQNIFSSFNRKAKEISHFTNNLTL